MGKSGEPAIKLPKTWSWDFVLTYGSATHVCRLMVQKTWRSEKLQILPNSIVGFSWSGDVGRVRRASSVEGPRDLKFKTSETCVPDVTLKSRALALVWLRQMLMTKMRKKSSSMVRCAQTTTDWHG